MQVYKMSNISDYLSNFDKKQKLFIRYSTTRLFNLVFYKKLIIFNFTVLKPFKTV